jgi:hypothetical protein
MIQKLAILYTVMNNYVVRLEKQHVLIFLELIKNTNLGELLIELCKRLRFVSSEWETAFLIVSKGDFIHVVLVVDQKDRFKPVLELLNAINTLLVSKDIKLELGTMETFTRSEWLPF